MGAGRDGDGHGILKGVGDLIDARLHLAFGGPPHYKHKKSCEQLSKGAIRDFDGRAFISEIYEKLKQNGLEKLQRGGKPPTKENFRWEPHTDFSSEHSGLEVPFERTVATLSKLPETEGFNLRNWTNQMPVASGLTDHPEGKRCIDLVHCCGGGAYDFIELKTSGPNDSDNPLHAAIEILLYGLIYVFSRVHREKLNYDASNSNPSKPNVLSDDTKIVNLLVIAPKAFYTRYNLEWFEKQLDSGLAALPKSLSPVLNVEMSFRFEEIASNFVVNAGDHGFVITFEPKPVKWNERTA